MKNSKQQLLETAKELMGVLGAIEGILENYEGIEGNKNYVKYCRNKSKESRNDEESLNQMLEDTYNSDMSKRKGINIATLIHIIERQFTLLDDIDTAGDMFKPKWCNITKVVEQLHRLRWVYCTLNLPCANSSDSISVNGEPYKIEHRVILNLD